MPFFRVIIVNYNGGAYLRAAVEGLLAQDFRDFEAVLVDNGSTDASLDGLPEDPRLSIIRAGRNLGFAAGNNRGVEGADAPWIVFLNPDAIPRPDWLARLKAATEAHPGVDFFGSTQLLADTPERADGFGDAYHVSGLARRMGWNEPAAPPYPSREVFGPCAAASMYRTSRYRELGGLNEAFFCYVEDVDLAFRHRLLGGTCWQVGDAIVHHHGSALTGRRSAFSTYYGLRNLIWAWWRSMPSALVPLLLPFHLVMVGVYAARCYVEQPKAVREALRDAWRGRGDIFSQRRTLQAARRASPFTILKALSWRL